MKPIIPPKLKQGDTIRIIAPSRSAGIVSPENKQRLLDALRKMGFNPEFSKHAEENDLFHSSSIASRVEDIHSAFSDSTVRGILTIIGGFNANQLLRYLNWDTIQQNPKVFCGYSDITALSNAILAKTGLVTYSGPHASTFAQEKGFEYTREYFQKCVMQEKSFPIHPSKEWMDDPWWKDPTNVNPVPNEGWLSINEGRARGRILGGNVCTLNLLQGTEFFPKIKNSILFIEDDDMSNDVTFDRDLQSLIHQSGFEKVRGLVIGRFQKKSEITNEKLIQIIRTKKELENIPVIANLDFGHTDPKITFPVGGACNLDVNANKTKLTILQH